MKILLSIIVYCSFITTQAKIIEVYDTQLEKSIDFEYLIQKLPAQGFLILGEYHNFDEIQLAQSQVIKEKVAYEMARSNFRVFWEFLNYTDAKKTKDEYTKFRNGTSTAFEFLINTAGEQNIHYAPIIETVKNFNGKITGINLPRVLKQKVISDGIGSIDPKYVPINHYAGGPDYLERFEAIMGGNVPAEKIAAYFEAQCLTDSVMAEQIYQHSNKDLNFVIAGSFHTDFNDATTIRLKNLTHRPVVTFKFVTLNLETQAEIDNYKESQLSYGHYADYIIVTK